MSTLPSGTLTFLFTDVESSTRLWDLYPDQMREVLARHDAIISRSVQHHSGHVVKPAGGGDSILAVFSRAPDAVAAALALQRALHHESWPPETPLRVRAAMHAGEAELRDDDYFGIAVNRCARLMAIAHGGQTLVSRSARELVREALPTGATLHPRGQHRLRDLQRPEDVYELLHPDLPDVFPPLRSLNALPNNLPFRLDSFVGRQSETEKVRQFLAHARLVTLTGPGGVGKTRLALHVAAELIGEFEDGVWWVDLARMASPDDVPQALATVLGARDEPSRLIGDVVAESIGDQRVLIVLDNAEHVRVACADMVESLLLHCSHLHVLSTSREPLGVVGELMWSLPPLSVGDVRPDRLVDGEPQSEALQLFVERAVRARPDFELTPVNADDICAICRHLDGLPLAIELAAARLDALAPKDILARLADRFKLLVVESTADPRHRSLRVAMDLSIDPLTEHEGQLFNRLSVFAADFGLEAAEQIGSGGVVATSEVIDLLTRLVRKSLVVASQDQHSRARYHLLETLRWCSRERLEVTGESPSTYGRLAEHYAAFVSAEEPLLTGANGLEALQRIAAEYDNVRAALRWAVQEEDLALMVRMVASLGRFWFIRGYFREGRDWLNRVFQMPDFNELPPTVRAKIVRVEGNLAYAQGDVVTARKCHEQCIDLCSDSDDEVGMALALNDLAIVSHQQGRFTEARSLYERSLVIERAHGDAHGVANTLINLGLLALWEDEIHTAETLFVESLGIARGLGDDRAIAQVQLHSAGIAQTRGDFAVAESKAEESLAAYRLLGDKYGTVLALNVLAMVSREQGQASLAGERLRESLDLAREIGFRWGLAEAIEVAGELDADAGNLDAATAALTSSLAIANEIGDRQFIADLLGGLGRLALGRGNFQEAARQHRQSLEIRRELLDGKSLDSCVSIEDLVGLLTVVGLQNDAVKFAGAADMFRERCGAPIQTIAKRRLERDMELARTALGEAAAAEAWATGRQLPLDLAVRRAVEIMGEIGVPPEDDNGPGVTLALAGADV